MKKDRARHDDRLAQLLFYGLIGLVGTVVGILISSLVTSSSPAGGLAIIAVAAVIVISGINLVLRWLVKRASERVAEAPAGGESASRRRRWASDLLVRVGSHVYLTR
jgi:hypothetical protein